MTPDERVEKARRSWHKARASGDATRIKKARKYLKMEMAEAEAEHRREWARKCEAARKGGR
jgi:hypothetical protein